MSDARRPALEGEAFPRMVAGGMGRKFPVVHSIFPESCVLGRPTGRGWMRTVSAATMGVLPPDLGNI